jgi:hypothetical protein
VSGLQGSLQRAQHEAAVARGEASTWQRKAAAEVRRQQLRTSERAADAWGQEARAQRLQESVASLSAAVPRAAQTQVRTSTALG